MKFTCKYIHRYGKEAEYYRTVWADNASEAQREADKYAKKGFICVSVAQN